MKALNSCFYMKHKRAYILTAIILSFIGLTYCYNRVYSLFLNKEYSAIDSYSSPGKYKITKIATEGKIVFTPIDLPGADPGVIYFDTLLHQFKITAQTYTEEGQEQNNVYTFDGRGKILLIDQFVPIERDSSYQTDKVTLNGSGKIISRTNNIPDGEHYTNAIPIIAILPPWPKYSDNSSPVYIRHFDKARLNLSDLNPLRLAGMNGGRPSAAWSGIAYCDVTFNQEVLKVKIPFDNANLFFGSNEFYADLQVYSLPKAYANHLDIAFLTIDEEMFIITQR